jgi:hypothetical protein
MPVLLDGLLQVQQGQARTQQFMELLLPAPAPASPACLKAMFK